MAKEWILNIATNRWGFNKKNSVGPVSLWIRECDPQTPDEWRKFYFQKLKTLLKEKQIDLTPEQYLQGLGSKLYTKITEVVQAEIDDVTEQDCLEYIYNLVIHRTFAGYQTEIKTIYEQLQQQLGVKIQPAPDQWDRLYNVDFYIEVEDKYIGLQIKPLTYEQTPEVHRWKEWLAKTHAKFEAEKGGKVFTIFSVKKGNHKEIFNPEVVEDIQMEINRLRPS